jgi:23S rRNA-/tRNA-specific pseudouridylate synthase
MSSFRFQVTKQEDGFSLVKFLHTQLQNPGSLRKIKGLIEKNCAFINGRPERFASAKVKTGDWVEFSNPLQQSIQQTLFEDDDLRIINKTPGIVSDKNSFSPLFLVHRLDKETSGCIILAKSIRVQEQLEDLFRNREVVKEYVAICKGHPPTTKGTCRSKIQEKFRYQGQTVYASGKEGKEAITHWEVEKQSKRASLIRCRPVTGRTHQIRVHLLELGVPIIGDYQYDRSGGGPIKVNRLLLHAEKICFTHPVTLQHLEIVAPWQEDFQQAFKALFS